ncbi:hypothetical protein GmHk_15G044227 [Glycine max]|nr:hypothetical protein GmHk_15G044227 [Glycine max]
MKGVEQTPPQTGLIELEYMRWYKRKQKFMSTPNMQEEDYWYTLMLSLLKIILITIHLFSMHGEIAKTLHFMVSLVGRRVCTLTIYAMYREDHSLSRKRIGYLRHMKMLPSQPQFEHQQLNILQESVETRGLARRRKIVDAATYSSPPMPKRQHGMVLHTAAFTQEPPHAADFCVHIWVISSFNGTPSFTQSGQVSTPNAPLLVRGMYSRYTHIRLIRVDLRMIFPPRRNPDRAGRNWDRPCGTSSRHHRHSDD